MKQEERNTLTRRKEELQAEIRQIDQRLATDTGSSQGSVSLGADQPGGPGVVSNREAVQRQGADSQSGGAQTSTGGTSTSSTGGTGGQQ